MKTVTQPTKITVCDKCFTVACWNGTVMCSRARSAGTITDTPENISKMAYGLAPTPQETPAQQGLVGQVTKMLATEAYHYCADCHGHCRQLILTVEALKESVRVNRDPAFQKLLEALANMCDKFYPHQCKYHGPAICDRCEALRQASEALRLAREGEK